MWWLMRGLKDKEWTSNGWSNQFFRQTIFGVFDCLCTFLFCGCAELRFARLLWIAGGTLQLVKVDGLKTWTNKASTDSFPYLSFSEVTSFVPTANYGIVLKSRISYAQLRSGNVAYAVHQPGISGSKQTIQSFQARIIQVPQHTVIDLADFIYGSDTVADCQFRDDFTEQLLCPKSLNAFRDSFNTTLGKKSPYFIQTIFYRLDSTCVSKLPSQFKLQLTMQFTDGKSCLYESETYSK